MGRITGLIFIAFGLVWCWDGWRLETTERGVSMFDELGPDRYLVVLGLIMLGVGGALVLNPPPNVVKLAPPVGGQAWRPGPPVTFTLALIAYTFAIPLLGYALSTLAFFIVIYHLAGERTVGANLAYAAVTAGVFYLLFPKISDMPLPVGPLGF